MRVLIALFIVLGILFVFFLIKYCEIELYDTIYLNKYDYSDQVVVIEKSLFSVSIARMNQDPEKIDIFYFLLNYTTGV